MKTNFSHLWFTLVELIVGVTISMILMVSVWVFVSGGMQNIFLQQKVFQNSNDFTQFNSILQTNLSYIDGDVVDMGTWVVFKSKPYFWNGWYTYIWTALQDGFYCSDTELVPPENTSQHLFIKNFIPHFEVWDTTLDHILTASGWWYTSYVKQHVVRDNTNEIIAWRQTFGEKLWDSWTGSFLNSPTGLAFDTPNNILFISDTLNNRILAYDPDDSSITLLLDESDGLNEPTWLFMSWSSLLIANSGNGEILEYSSRVYAGAPDLNMSFTGSWDSFNKIRIWIKNKDTHYIPTESLVLSNYSFTGITNNSDFVHQITQWWNNYLDYYFATFWWSEQAISGCNWVKDYISWNIYECRWTNSWVLASLPNKTLSIAQDYGIGLENLTTLTDTGSYYVDLELFDSSDNSIYNQFFPYFTQWDDNLLTQNDNTLRAISVNLDYPTYISWPNIPADVVGFNIDSFTRYSFSGTYDSVLETPVENFGVNIIHDWLLDSLLTLTGTYYKSYDCYNEDNRITRDFIWKKNLK